MFVRDMPLVLTLYFPRKRVPLWSRKGYFWHHRRRVNVCQVAGSIYSLSLFAGFS